MTIRKPPTYKRRAYEKIWEMLQEIEYRRLTHADDAFITISYVDGEEFEEQFYFEQHIEEETRIYERLVSMGALADLGKSETRGELPIVNTMKKQRNYGSVCMI